MSGAIALVAQENARYNQFTVDLALLDKPDGWEVLPRFGWDLADAHNALIQQALDRGHDHVWFMADDHAFSPNLLKKLLKHDLDLVIPVCLMRNPPYRPVNWVLDTDDATKTRRIELADYPDGGLAEVEATGAAGLLVKRRVFEAIEPPWFTSGTGITNRVGEDIGFCRNARAAGFRIFCDLDSVLGHCCTSVVWPVREHDGWTFGFSFMGGFQVTMPPGFQAYADEVGA